MKKTILSLLTVLTIGFTAQAQVSIIPKAGVTLSNVAFEETLEGKKSASGLLFGVGFNFPLGEIFSIQPEILYLQKGFAGTFNVNAEDLGEGFEELEGEILKLDTKMRLNYLEIPLLAKVSFGSESLKVYLNAGPSLGYGIGGTTNSKGNFLGFPFDTTGKVIFGEEPDNANEEDTYFDNRIDLGVQFGGGLAFKAGPGSLILDARYGFGLSNLQKTPDPIPAGQSSSDYKSQNRVIAVSLGYSIPLGGK